MLNEATPLEADMLNCLMRLQTVCHTANAKWWTDPATGQPIDPHAPHLVGEKLMLIVSEVAEGMEGHRKGRHDDHLPEFLSLSVELADAMIRIFDLAGALKLNLSEAFVAKMRYNATRLDHTYAARLAPGGKAY